MIFLYFFFDVVANKNENDADIIRRLWLSGIIPFMIGLGIIFNGLIISRRLVKLKEQQAQTPLSKTPAPTSDQNMLPAKTTDQLIVDTAPPSGSSVTENTTAHLHEPVPAPPRRESG